MATIVLVIHLLIGLSLVGAVLLQRSEGGLGGLGGGGASGGMGGLLGNRQTANLLTRSTAFLAAAFMVTSISLAVLASVGGRGDGAIVQDAPASQDTSAAPVVPPAPIVPTGD
jgi:preprotein translocase subunit SecG